MNFFCKRLRKGAYSFFFLTLFIFIVGTGAVELVAQPLNPGDIVVTEFMADPVASSDQEGEYVELYNKRSIASRIEGFTLSDGNAEAHQIDSGGSLTIPPKSFMVLASSATPGFTPDYVYEGLTFDNSGAKIILSDAEGNEITRLNYSDSNIPEGGALELNDIGRINIEGRSAIADYSRSQSVLRNGDNGLPGMAGITSITKKSATDERDTLAFVFNEINADPGDDANGDGTIDPDSDEFVELVNNSNEDIDISGWTFSDSSRERFTFPNGTVLPAGHALLLFGEGTNFPKGNFGGALVFTAAELGLDDTSEKLALYDANGNEIAATTYSNNASGESNNLNPEITGNRYADHSSLTGAGGSLSSPGTKADGTAFGSMTYAHAFRGSEGWRLITSPSQNTSFSDLFAGLSLRGISTSGGVSQAANLFSWQENGDGFFDALPDVNTDLKAGNGYLVYVFEDNNADAPGIQGGFPKVISTDNPENRPSVSVAVSSHDINGNNLIDNSEGYNLLGNPFGTDISVDAVISALEEVTNKPHTVNANVYIWDHEANGGNGAYISLAADESGKTIDPFQAFFVRYEEGGISGEVSFNRNDLAAKQGAQFYNQGEEGQTKFEIYLGDGNKYDMHEVVFRKDGVVGKDRLDAYKLSSLNANSITLYSKVENNARLTKNVLPEVEELNGELRIPLGYDVSQSGQYTFSWSNLDDISTHLKLYLVDRKTGRKMDIRTVRNYSFNVSVSEKAKQGGNNSMIPSLARTSGDTEEARFELLAVSSAPDQRDEVMEQKVALSPNYPNPFQAETRMDLKLQESMHVKVTIWNIVGQKVGTLMDQMMPEGEEPMTWNVPANLPSGIYICKVEAGGEVITRKMTLVK